MINRARTRHFALLEERFEQAAVSRGFTPVFFDRPADFSESSDRIAALGEHIAETEAQLVFAVGGDGTVRLCVEAISHESAVLAIGAVGAANLVAHALGVPSDLDAAIRTGFGDHERRVDLAVVNGQISLAMAGIGSDAAVVRATPALFKRHLGWVGYGLFALPHLRAASHDFEIRLDDREPLKRKAHSIVVGNVGILPGGFVLLPDALMDDGQLDIGIIDPEGLFGWLHFAAILLAHHMPEAEMPSEIAELSGSSPLEHFRARHVEITTDEELACEVDGEVIGTARTLTASVRERALRVRIP